MDALQPVPAVTHHREEREAPEEPRDVVHEDVPRAKYKRRPKDGVRQTRAHDSLFHQSLPTEIREGRMAGGIGDAQMDDPRDAGRPAGAEQGEGVFNGRLKRRLSARETNPIGVVKDGGSLETLGELV